MQFFCFYCAKDLSVSDAKILKTHWCVYEGKVNFTYVNEKRSSVLMCTTLGLLQRGLKYIDTSEAEEMPVSRESKQTENVFSAVQIYDFHVFLSQLLHLRVYNELTIDQLPVGLIAQLVRALHRYSQRSWVRFPFRPEFFFQALFLNCLS